MTAVLLRSGRFYVPRLGGRWSSAAYSHQLSILNSDDFEGRRFSTKKKVYVRDRGVLSHNCRFFYLDAIPRPVNPSNQWMTPCTHLPYLYDSTKLSNKFNSNDWQSSKVSFCVDCQIRRSLHTARPLWKEKDSVVGKSVESLKDEKKQIEPVQQPKSLWERKKAKWSATLAEMKKTGYLRYMWNGLKHFVLHYKDGFVLLWKNFKICVPLLVRFVRSGRSSLKRREYNLLTRTLADIVRMVPLIPMILIPLGEILIPLYIKIGMMPSVFSSKKDTADKHNRQLNNKLEYAGLLSASLKDIPLQKGKTGSSIQDFTAFMEKVKSSETIPSIDEIAKFSTLFADNYTLDDLTVTQLQALCKLLGIGFLGSIPSAPVLRFQIMMKVRELEVDDRIIQKEGIDCLTSDELQSANRARGMRAIGLSQERLSIQLQQWLELHLKLKVPTSLLLLSRIMYFDENLSPAEQLKQTIKALPESTVEKVAVSSAETKGEAVDKKTKIKLLDQEVKAIEQEKLLEKEEERKKLETTTAERTERERQLAEMALHKMEEERVKLSLADKLLEERPELLSQRMKDTAKPLEDKVVAKPDVVAKDITEDVPPVVEDKAEPIVTKPEEADEDITAQDLGDIEKAIENLAMHHQDELSEVREDLDEYLEDMQDIKTLSQDVDIEKRFNETKGAALLRSKLDKYLQKLDKTIYSMQDEKMEIQAKLDQQEVDLKYDLDGDVDELKRSIDQKRHTLISRNDIILSLKRLQKTPDDVKMQQILEVLDTDEDGLIDINDVLKVTELLGRENLKLNKTQLTAMMKLLKKEEELEQESKRKKEEAKEGNNGNNGQKKGGPSDKEGGANEKQDGRHGNQKEANGPKGGTNGPKEESDKTKGNVLEGTGDIIVPERVNNQQKQLPKT